MTEILKAKRQRGTGSVYPRGATWWAQYYGSNGKIRVSTGETDPKKAERFLRRKIGEVEAGIAPAVGSSRVKYEDFRAALLLHYQAKKRKWLRHRKDGGEAYVADLCHVDDYFRGWRVKAITTDAIEKFVLKRQEEGAANGTVNRALSLLRRMFMLQVKRDKIRRNEVPYFEMLEESGARQGFLQHADYQKLRQELPEYLRPVLALAYHTAMRKGEILGLRWDTIDLLAAEIRLYDTKNGEPRTIPLAGEVLEMLKIERERNTGEWVFTRDGEPIGSFFKAWKSAAKRAGLPGLLFHDLRRSGIRNLVRSGVSESVAMKISGHKDPKVFSRYNVTSTKDLKDAASKLEHYLAQQVGHISGTIAPSGESKAAGKKVEEITFQ
jgi:integrase